MTIVTLSLLLVDDCLEDRETYRRYLLGDKQHTYRILEVSTGKQALELCRQEFPDVIVTDYLLPDMDGLELIDNLKTQFGQTNLPAIVLTGQGNEQVAVQAMKSGAADYLVKKHTTPVSLRLAIQNVRERTGLSRQLLESEARFLAKFNPASVDITDRKLAEQKLAMSESQYRLLFERNPNPMWIFDPETLAFLAVNQAAIAHYGYSESEFLAMTLVDIRPPEDILVFQATIEDYRLNDCEFVYRGEWRHCKRDGSIIDVEITSRRIIWSGKLADFVMVKDISARKQAQERLETYAAELEELYNNAPCGYHSVDKDGTFLRINDTELKMLGYSRQEVVGKMKFSDLLTPESLITFQENFPLFQEQGWVRDLEFQMICQDGTILPISLSATAIKDAAGNYLLNRSVVVDISDRKLAQEALRRSEEQRRLVLDLTNTGVWDWNIATGETIWNDNNYHLLGLIPNSVAPSYQTWRDRVHPEDIESVEQAVNQALDTQTDFEIEYRVIYPDGSLHWLMARSRGIYDESGQAVRMIGMVFDISDRKQAELSLWETQQQLQAILNNSPAVIYLLDSQNRHILVNRSYAELLSTTAESLIGKSIYEVWPREIADIFAANNQRVLQGNQAIEVEEIVPHAEGMYTYITIKFPLHDANGIPDAVCGISTDITERKLAQEKIREQAALLDVATDAIFVRDLEHRILYWNCGAERLYGWLATEVMGRNSREFLYKQITPSLGEAFNTVIEQGEWQGELKKIAKSGQEIIVQSRWTLMRDRTGQPKSILAVDTDITAKKQLEQQFYRAQRLESLGILASGIAHDLNNILTPMLAVAQLLPLKLPNLNEQNQRLLKILEDNSKRGAELVKQITAFARGAEGKRVPIQPKHLLKEVEQIVKSTFPKSLEICIDIATPNLWTVLADPTQIHQVLMNLCVNARDAMADGGTLTISAENFHVDENYAKMNLDAKVGDYVAIAVSDTGCGMPQELLERIFEPFFTTKELGKGTGLGLSTVIGIIKNHDGFVNVYSEVGKGSKFQVYLSAIDTSVTEEADNSHIARGNGELILVVDDEASVRDVAKTSLEEFNYRVLIANDGIEAFSLYAKHKNEISLVLMDIQMPFIDGFKAISVLQQMNPSVKIIVISGLKSNHTLLETRKINVQGFLSKPYTIKELLDTIKGVLSAP